MRDDKILYIVVPCYNEEEVLPESSEVLITIYEGKYHQVKRMFAACGNKVVGLKRLSIGNLYLDSGLALGECRELTQEELNLLK